MNKEHILKRGNNTKVLEYILKAESFNIEDYKLLTQNSGTKYHEYLIPIIKYKFNIEPTIEMFKDAVYVWKKYISRNIKFDILLLDYYLDNTDEYTDDLLSSMINKCEESSYIIDNAILDKLIDLKYYFTLDKILSNYKSILDETILKKIFNLNVSCFYYTTWKSSFETHKIFYDFLKNSKDISGQNLLTNLHFFDTDEDTNNLINVIKQNNITCIDHIFNKTSLVNKQMIKIFFTIGNIYMDDKYIKKIIKSNKEIWNYIDLTKVIYTPLSIYRYEYDNDNIEQNCYTMLESLYNKCTIKRYVKCYYDVPILIMKIILSRVTIDKIKLESLRNNIDNNKALVIKDAVNFHNDFIEVLDSYINKENNNKKSLNMNKLELPIIN